jgi:putative ABC transport system permease protein
MLYIYVSNELSFDKFHSKSDRIFRAITIDKRIPDEPRSYGVAPAPFGPELREKFPEVEDMVRLHRFVGQVVFEINGNPYQERNWYTTDSNFFNVFDFEFISGNRLTALKEPHSLVMTQRMAKKYFGDADAIGQIIEQTSFGPVTVTGVIKDQPGNSHLQFDMLFSNVNPGDAWEKYLNNWQSFEAFTYIVLDDAHSISSLKSKMASVVDEHFSEFEGGIGIDFQCIEDIYLGSENIEASTASGHGQRSYIYIFSSMGIFLLLIACINYINLATSKAMARSREIGVRKVVGAHKRQLVIQFLIESFVFTLLSMIVSISVMDIVFPYFNQITGKAFDVSWESLQTFLLPLLGISLIVGLISGGYPALYMARLKPVSSLKGKIVGERNAVSLRNSLVVFQFALTIIMIVSTMVIGRQLNFIQQKDIGFDKDQLVIIDINSGGVRRQFQTIKNEYANIPGVLSVAVSSRVPGEWKNIPELYVRSSNSMDGVPDSVKTYFMGFDEDILKTYRLRLKDGNFFSSNAMADSTAILLNESAVNALKLSDPVGSVVKINTQRGTMDASVIGVIKDFNFQSLHQKVAPIIIGTWNNPIQSIDYFTLKVTGDAEELIPAITKVHEKFDQATPMEYHYLDEQLAVLYAAEKRVGMIFQMGGALSIFVACLGLLGLATYNIERRTKELGVRKVLGARALNLFLLLSSSFTRQVGIAYLIACPIAYFGMRQWLSIFEYRIPLHVGIFLSAGGTALLIALITISYRSLKAAYASPLNALRQE